VTVAARGALYISANSPNDVPLRDSDHRNRKPSQHSCSATDSGCVLRSACSHSNGFFPFTRYKNIEGTRVNNVEHVTERSLLNDSRAFLDVFRPHRINNLTLLWFTKRTRTLSVPNNGRLV